MICGSSGLSLPFSSSYWRTEIFALPQITQRNKAKKNFFLNLWFRTILTILLTYSINDNSYISYISSSYSVSCHTLSCFFILLLYRAAIPYMLLYLFKCSILLIVNLCDFMWKQFELFYLLLVLLPKILLNLGDWHPCLMSQKIRLWF